MFKKLNNFLKSYWLKDPSWGLRRILFSYSLFLLLIFSAFLVKEKYFFVNMVIFDLVFTIYLIWKVSKHGFYHRLIRLVLPAQELELIDYILPTNREKNLRSLNIIGTSESYGRMFFEKKICKSFQSNKIKLVLDKLFPLSLRDVLFLGGGGCDLPKKLIDWYPKIKPDVVEICPQTIEIAKEFFLNKNSLKKINFIEDNAYTFILKRNKLRYQFIFHDIFTGVDLPKFTLKKHFISKLRDSLSEDGILVVNTGFGPFNVIKNVIVSYRAIFPKVYLTRSNKNIVILALNSNNLLFHKFLTKSKWFLNL